MSHPFKIAATKISADGNRFRSSFKLLFFILAAFIAVPGLLTIHSPADVFAGPTDSKEECEAAGGQWTMVAIDNCVNYTVDPNATDPNSSKEACEAAGKQWLIMQIGTLRCVDKVGANSTVSKLTIDKQALSYALVNSFTKCIQDEQYQQVDSINLSAVRWFYINDDNAKSGKWWFTEGGMLPWIRTDGASKFASYLSADVRTSDNGGDGRTLCNNILSQAKNLWEYPSALDFLCDGGLTRDDGSPCQGSIIRFGDISGSEKAKAIRGGITRKAYGGATPNLKIDAADGYPGLYVLYKAALEQGCRAAPSSESADSKYVHQIKVVSKGGTVTETRYVAGVDGDTERTVYTNYDLEEIRAKCSRIAEKTNEHSVAFAKYAKLNPDEEVASTSGNNNPTTGTEDEVSSCPVEGIGWVVCPVLNAMGGLADAMWGLTEKLLTVSPLQTHDPSTGAETTFYAVWKQLMGITNAGFVIVFLIIIFSQLIGGANLNYGIKKMLPRLIVGVILGSLSFLIMQLAVDLANILGSAIYDMLNSISAGGAMPSWESAITLMVTGGLAIGVGVAAIAIAPGASLLIALVAVLPVLIGFIAAVLTLIVRQALIPILAILAPLAFLARVLPNTEKWFSKWLSLFVSMLLLYPLAALLFGGIKLSAYMINSAGGTWSSLIALIVMGVPLFLLPFIARQAGPMLGKLNSSIRNLGSKAGNPLSNMLNDRRKSSTAKSLAKTPGKWNIGRRAVIASKTRKARRNLVTEAYQAQTTANQNEAIGNTLDKDFISSVPGAAAQAHLTQFKGKLEAKELSDALQQLAKELSAHKAKGGNGDEFLRQKATSGATAAERSAAMHTAAQTGRDEVIRGLQSTFKGDSSEGKNSEALQRAIDANASSLAGKAPDLVKGTSAFSSFSGADMAGWSKGTAQAFVDHVRSSDLSGNKGDVEAALSALATATQDIKGSSDLQAKFSGEAGKNILKGAIESTGIAEALGGSMGDDGKIR